MREEVVLLRESRIVHRRDHQVLKTHISTIMLTNIELFIRCQTTLKLSKIKKIIKFDKVV